MSLLRHCKLQYRQDVFPIAHYHVQQKKVPYLYMLFLYFLYQWKQKGIALLYKQVSKIYHLKS